MHSDYIPEAEYSKMIKSLNSKKHLRSQIRLAKENHRELARDIVNRIEMSLGDDQAVDFSEAMSIISDVYNRAKRVYNMSVSD